MANFFKDYQNVVKKLEGKTMKKYLFTFEWVHGNRCVNDYIIEWLKQYEKEAGYSTNFHYNHFFELVADIYGINQYLKFDYEKINGNTYGVFIKKEA